MKPFLKLWITASLLCLTNGGAFAQKRQISETRNAALRYWIAFADLQDSSADKETQTLLEKTATGDLPWDEGKLGPIVEKNEEAILGMQRATKLPECDWGLEYSRGPLASIAPVVKARILARLNTLYGMHLASKGDMQGAVDTWLAGIHFSQDMAKGGSLIFALIAKSSLLANMNAIQKAADSGRLSGSQKQASLNVLRALPEDGLDWRSAWMMDSASTEEGLGSVLRSPNPRLEYQRLFGEILPETVVIPGFKMHDQLHDYFERAGDALHLPPSRAEIALTELEQLRRSIDESLSRLIPSPTRVNDARKEIVKVRSLTMRSLSIK